MAAFLANAEDSRPGAQEGGAAAGKSQWLVHHYCQGEGLAGCIQLLCRDVSVEFIDQHRTSQEREDVLARIGTFDRIVVEPSIARELAEAVDPNRLIVVPTLAFRGYHPDFFVLRRDGVAVPGPTGSSQSLLAFCAFTAGMPVEAAVALHRQEVYAACGYFDEWTESRELLLASFSRHGLDLGAEFIAWSRRGPFMYSIIHPHIACMHDIARQVLVQAGMRLLPASFLPPDRLARHEVVPVYPAIATRLGIAGGTLFKRGHDQRILDLPEYVARSYAIFRSAPDARPHGAYVPVVERVQAALEAFA